MLFLYTKRFFFFLKGGGGGGVHLPKYKNIRDYVILEQGNSISLNIRTFFRMDFFYFSGLGLQVDQGAAMG